MHTGRPEDLSRREAKAAELAAQIARILTAIDELGVGPTMAANGRITGPAFEIRRISNRWTVRA